MDAQKNPGVLGQPQGCVGSPGEAQAVVGMLQQPPDDAWTQAAW